LSPFAGEEVILDFHFGNSQEHCMKKLVFASAMALASICLVSTPTLRAQVQAQGQTIQIQDPAEFNAYQNFSTQTDAAQKCAAGESFLTTYPQSVVKKEVLDGLIDCYNATQKPNQVLSAASRLLQLDPNNFKAIFYSAYVKKNQCAGSLDPATGVSKDPQTCDDAAALAQKGLALPQPAGMDAATWKNLTANAFPVFHSVIALDDLASKKDVKGAEEEYTKELNLYSLDDCSKPGPCLIDTLQLAQAYAMPGDARDEIKAVWFYARALDFAPPSYKPQIEERLGYWYKRYHGTMDGDAAIKQQIDAIKTQAQSTLMPPAGFTIKPAPTPSDIVDNLEATTPDLRVLNLEDKEYILANGSQAAQDKLWGLLKGQQTPVPGVVIADPASVLKISVTTLASPKPKDYVVKLTTPGPCASVPPPPSELKIKDAQAYILANGVKADTDAMGDVLTEAPAKIHKIEIDPAVTVFNVAVTEDAKGSHTADFTVNLKDPASCKDAPAVGAALATQPADELDGTYDTYTKVAAQGSTAASAQIVLGDGFLQPAKKAPVHHTPAKPSPAHRPAGM
jgi:hypothetical protein